jgi:hypothetical protein
MRKSILILLLILSSCSKEDNRVTSYLDSFATDIYFNEEVFTGNYQDFYGLWKVFEASGGWSGFFEPDFDFLEIKPFGIYGFVRNDTLYEYGKITPNYDILPNFPGLPVKLEPEYTLRKHPTFGSTMYFEMVRKDTLCVSAGIADGVSFVFNRNKK